MLGLGKESATKKCHYCCKWLLLICFATKPKTNELYSKCETCRPKAAKKSHAKRDAKVAEKRASIEAKLESGELVRCESCGPLPLAAFEIHPTTGNPFTRCKPCNVTKNEQQAEYNKTEAGKERNKRAKTSKKGKATQRRYREGDAGQAKATRFLDNLQERRRESSAMRMDNAIMCASSGLISGRRESSPTFLQRTSFASEVQYLNVLKATFEGEMDFDNHGTVWEVDHKIPREAYDFEDPEDVKRCWSAKNVHAMTVAANLEKSWKLIDEYIAAAGVANYPKAWNGKPPDDVVKITHNAKMVDQKAIDDDEEALDDDEEEVLDDDSDF